MNDLNLVNKYNSIRNASIFNGCFHQDPSCNSVIKAHSVQNNGILNRISKDSHVLCIDFSKLPDKGLIDLQLVGKKKASTFTGFCGVHDKIFSPIETQDYSPGNREQEFLFAYRALALGYYERYSAYQFNKIELSNPDLTPEYRKKTEAICNEYEKHIKVVEGYRTAMNLNLDKQRFSKISTNILVWPEEYGVAVSSMITIYRDLLGRTVNHKDYYYSPTLFTVFPQGGYTYVLMGCFTKDKGRFEEVFKQIANYDIDQQKVLVTNMIAGKLENFFISPDLWESLPKEMKNRVIEVLNDSARKRQYDLVRYRDLNIFQSNLS